MRNDCIHRRRIPREFLPSERGRRRKEEGGRREGGREGGRDFLFSQHFSFYSVVCVFFNFISRRTKKKKAQGKKKEGKKKRQKTQAATSSLELLPPPSKTPHSLLRFALRSLGPARSHRRTNERIRSIHFPTARNGLEVNFDRKWIKSFRVELVAADERHAAPRVAFQFCNENVKRRERERPIFPSKSDLQKWQRFCSTRARRDTPCSRLKIWIGSEIRRKPWQKPSSTFYCTRFLLFPSLDCILGRHQNAFDARGQIFPLSLSLSLSLPLSY